MSFNRAGVFLKEIWDENIKYFIKNYQSYNWIDLASFYISLGNSFKYLDRYVDISDKMSNKEVQEILESQKISIIDETVYQKIDFLSSKVTTIEDKYIVNGTLLSILQG